MSEKSLKQKTLKGVGWTAADSVLRYGVSFFVGIILARLLSPDDYGLIGILMIFVSTFNVLIDAGLINAVIRKQDAKDIDYCTIFYANLILSVVLAAIIFFSAGFIASYFERMELVSLTKAMSVIVIINALSTVHRARFTKELNFRIQTRVSFIAGVISGIIGIGMAYTGFGVWSLVGQQLSNAVVTTLLYWIYNHWVPKFSFSWDSFHEMWGFAWKLLVSGVLNSISGQLHNIVIGKYFKPSTLGQYTRAQQFGSLFSDNLTTIIQRVTFPVLSTIQDDPVYLKEAYRRVIKVTVFPTFVMMMGLAACAVPLLVVLIGEKWLDAAHYLQIISFSMMLYPLHALNLNAIQVMGRSDLTLRINVIKNLLIIIPVVIGIKYGIIWMLIADVARGYACYYLNAYYTKYVINYSVWEQVKDIMPSIKLGLMVALPMYVISYIHLPYLLLLIIQLIIGGGLFLFICEKKQYMEYDEIKRILIKVVERFK